MSSLGSEGLGVRPTAAMQGQPEATPQTTAWLCTNTTSWARAQQKGEPVGMSPAPGASHAGEPLPAGSTLSAGWQAACESESTVGKARLMQHTKDRSWGRAGRTVRLAASRSRSASLLNVASLDS